MKPTPLGPFVGINNRVPAHQLHIGERGKPGKDQLRNAVNVDATDSGTLQRRPGVTLRVAATDAHSLWGADDSAFYVDNDTLYQYPRTAIRSGLTPGMRASFAATPRGVVWTNGAVIERIEGGVSGRLAPATPNPPPLATAAADGALSAGLYQFVFTAVGADGSESPATWAQQITVAEGQRVSITGLPGTLTRAYMTPVNGDALFLIAETTETTLEVPLFQPIGEQPVTDTLIAMPPGQIVREHAGRLLVAAGSTLYVSEPYAYGLLNPMRGFVPFTDRITVVEPVEGGVFVCADKTYWFPGGNPAEAASADEVLPYGGVEGTGGANPLTKEAYWFSPRGLVVGDKAGQPRNVQEATVAVDAAALGAQLFRDQNGLRQVITSLFGGTASTAAATSYMDAEIIRKESML